MVFSVVGLVLAAKYFGVSVDRDMWLIALNCMVVLELALWGPINETFRAKFILLREEIGEDRVMDKTRSLLLVIGIVSCVVVSLVLLFPTHLAQILAPAYGGAQLQALALMVAVIAPSFIINQFCHIGISILNAYESFYVPEIAALLTSIINIALLIALAPVIGIYSLMVSYYTGMILLVFLLFFTIRRRRIPLFTRLGRITMRDFTPFFVYALPFFIPYFFVQANLVLEKSLATLISDGAVSTIDYARKFVDIPVNVLTSVMMTMLVPVLSARYAKRDTDGFLQEFRRVYQLGLLLIAVLLAFFCSSAREFMTVLLWRGDYITTESVGLISDLTVYYAFTALAAFHYIIFGLALLSSGKGKIYAGFGVLAQLIMIGLNILGYKEYGVYIFPISFVIAHVVAAIALIVYFPNQRKAILRVGIKYAPMFPWMVVIAILVNGRSLGIANPYVILAFNASVIGVAFFIGLYLFRMEERTLIPGFLKQLKQYLLGRSHQS